MSESGNQQSSVATMVAVIGIIIALLAWLLPFSDGSRSPLQAALFPPTSTPSPTPTQTTPFFAQPVSTLPLVAPEDMNESAGMTGGVDAFPTLNTTQTLSYRTSCNWAYDWDLQPDGSFLWVGQHPGTPECPNVAQAGELMQRLKNGENLTLVIEIGDIPLGLNICVGEYTATTATSGSRCVPYNPELWPQVSGTLTVTGSTGPSGGFLVGTGE